MKNEQNINLISFITNEKININNQINNYDK